MFDYFIFWVEYTNNQIINKIINHCKKQGCRMANTLTVCIIKNENNINIMKSIIAVLVLAFKLS